MKTRLFALLAATLIACPSRAAEAPTLGGAPVTIPSPPGQVTLGNRASPYYQLIEQVQKQMGNRLFAVFLPAPAAALADASQPHESPDWSIVGVPASGEAQVITATVFARDVVPVLERAIENAMADSGLQKKLDGAVDKGVGQVLREHGAEGQLALKVGVMSPIGVYVKAPGYATFGAATKLKVTRADGTTDEIPVVMMLSTLNINQRILSAAVYRVLRTRQDVDIARARALAWSDALVAANR